MKKSYMTDYPRLNVIYDETVGLQARRFTTPAKYHSHPEDVWRINATFVESKCNCLTFLHCLYFSHFWMQLSHFYECNFRWK